MLARLFNHLSPEDRKHFFYLAQITLGALFFAGYWFRRQARDPGSGFRVREADRLRRTQAEGNRLRIAAGSIASDDLANAKMKRQEPLRLTGIRIDGPPHEVLGVSPQADASQVQKAYRERMKQYHPDKVGRPGTREWQDAQKIAEALNRAKNAMLERLQAQNPNRSGR